MLETPHILIADDSPDLCAILTRMLTRVYPAATIERVANGAAALDCIDQRVPDLLILDHDLPTIKGLAAVYLLRAQQIDRPILLLCTSDEPGPALPAAGATQFVAKPFSLAGLRHALAAVVAMPSFSGLQERQAGDRQLLQRER